MTPLTMNQNSTNISLAYGPKEIRFRDCQGLSVRKLSFSRLVNQNVVSSLLAYFTYYTLVLANKEFRYRTLCLKSGLKLISLLVLVSLFNSPSALANPNQSSYVNKVVDAIYRAEGGSKTKHPYGILSVKTRNPRQVCYEVVNWRYAMWSSMPIKDRPSFISYLSKSYCPMGAKNDPSGLNRNWVRNVSYFMEVAK